MEHITYVLTEKEHVVAYKIELNPLLSIKYSTLCSSNAAVYVQSTEYE